jgi:hypothetical protein
MNILPPPPPLRTNASLTFRYFVQWDTNILQPAFQSFQEAYSLACGAARMCDGHLLYASFNDAETELCTRTNLMTHRVQLQAEFVPAATLAIAMNREKTRMLCAILVFYDVNAASP